ncbi:MAG: hypothetical protein EBS29_05685 [Chloroflexia bacterium]|nr:hypothetical protein [Chloroflexia bacterium]
MHAPKLHYQIAAHIWVGSYIGNGLNTHVEAQLQWLMAHDITQIIDLTAPSDELPSYVSQLAQYAPQMVRISFAISDGDIPAPATMLAILDAISAAQQQHASVYIHSWRGISRAGMVAACWLMRQGYDATTARDYIQQLLPLHSPHEVPEFQVQRDFVHAWKEPDTATAQRWRRWRDVFRGALVGGAIGDALGITNEHQPSAVIRSVTDIVGGGPFGLPAGWWSDDTAGMLCVVTSLIAKREFDAHDQAQRLLQLWRDGYLACGGRTYDFGNINMTALYRYMITNHPYTTISTDHSAGNGSLVRVAPIGLFYATTPYAISECARDASRITHGAMASIHACQIVALLVARTLFCHDKATLFSNYWYRIPADAPVRAVLSGTYSLQRRRAFQGSYVLESLDEVFYGLLCTHDFASGALLLANAGGMQGAACTVYGQIAGAFYGESAIPLHWRQKIARYHEIAWYADTLLRAAWNSLPHAAQIPPQLFSEA